MKILMLKTGKEYEVLREKSDYYVYKIGNDEFRIYKRVEGEEFIIVGKEYSWGVVRDQVTSREDFVTKPSPFPPIAVKINYEDSEIMENRLKKFTHKS